MQVEVNAYSCHGSGTRSALEIVVQVVMPACITEGVLVSAALAVGVVVAAAVFDVVVAVGSSSSSLLLPLVILGCERCW